MLSVENISPTSHSHGDTAPFNVQKIKKNEEKYEIFVFAEYLSTAIHVFEKKFHVCSILLSGSTNNQNKIVSHIAEIIFSTIPTLKLEIEGNHKTLSEIIREVRKHCGKITRTERKIILYYKYPYVNLTNIQGLEKRLNIALR